MVTLKRAPGPVGTYSRHLLRAKGKRVTKVDELGSVEDQMGVYTFRVYAEEVGTLVGPAAQAVLAVGADVRDLSVKRPTLEEVFIYLTGRQLR